MDLTDEPWAVLEPFLPEAERIPARQGGRPWRNPREVLHGVLGVLRTGAPWRDLPKRYPPYPTCHRRFRRWVRTGVMEAILRALAEDLKVRGQLDLQECFIDGTFGMAKKGATGVGKTQRGKGTKLMAVADGTGLPIAVCVTSARPHEVTLVEATLASGFAPEPPKRWMGDRAYDSDPLDARWAARGIEMIAPHRSSWRKERPPDGRKLRPYKRRWKIERLFAWLGHFRRRVVRYERHWVNYLGFG
ncbi:MAG: IS5 family transposase [Candidatus Caldarchaeum sp.]